MKDDIIYWDTDGIIIKKPLNKHYIDVNLLGKFKLVAEIKEFAAIATKFYIYTTTDNKFIPVLRGINSKEFIINEKYFYDIFKEVIYINMIGNYKINFEFFLPCINNQTLINFNFTFTNKRRVIHKNNLLKTRPWFLVKN